VLSYHRLKENFRALRTFTSVDHPAFETLLPSFAAAWHAYVYDNHITKNTHKRRFGGGRKARLASPEDKLLFILVYCKLYPLQEVMASLCAMSQGRVNAWIHTLSAVLESALGHAQCVPERDPQNLEQVFAMCVSVDFLIDGTERPIQRPQDPVKQQEYYSGKKNAYRET
jgi:hypothetical protein